MLAALPSDYADYRVVLQQSDCLGLEVLHRHLLVRGTGEKPGVGNLSRPRRRRL